MVGAAVVGLRDGSFVGVGGTGRFGVGFQIGEPVGSGLTTFAAVAGVMSRSSPLYAGSPDDNRALGVG